MFLMFFFVNIDFLGDNTTLNVDQVIPEKQIEVKLTYCCPNGEISLKIAIMAKGKNTSWEFGFFTP